MNNFYIIEIIGNFINAIMMIYFFNKVMPPKCIKYKNVYTVIMIIIYASIPSHMANNILINQGENKIFIFIFNYYIIMLIYPIFFRIGSMAEKFVLLSFYVTTMLICSITVFIIASRVLNTTFSEIVLHISYKRSICILIIKLIQFLLLLIMLKNISFIKYIKDKTLYLGGIILILNQILIFVSERSLLEELDKISMYSIAIVLILFIISILSIYMLNILSKEMEEKFILRMNLDRKLHDEEIIDMYTKMTGWKHDFRNHISMISGLLKVGTKEDAILYINELNSNVNILDKKIYTNNIAVNSILGSKINIAKEKDIKIELDLKIDTEIKISNVDICIILGNILDNSIEACDLIKGYRFIDLKIVSESSRLIIKISNSTNGYVNEVDGRFTTRKGNGMHGIGLIQVDSIVKKYDGYIDREHENNIFTTYIMIEY